ncbi:Transcription repressor (Ovate family protein), partial [Psidium guajava]
NSRRRLLLNTVAVDVGCSCRKPKLFLHSLLKPSSKPKPSSSSFSSSSSGSSSTNHHKRFFSHSHSSSTTTGSPSAAAAADHSLQYLLDAEADVAKSAKAVRGFGRIDEEGVAVEKESHDPYLDFRHSMLQMILENQIDNKDDLRELLNCFLQLNSPYYHGVIVRAFTEIWNGVFCVRPAAGHHSPLLHFAPKSWEF